MRILGFSKKDWINHLTGSLKLGEDVFTTFRFTRRDRDWQVGELVQVVYKPRRKGGGEKLGIAEIIDKEQRWLLRGGITALLIAETEAKRDGFHSVGKMVHWVSHTYKARNFKESMNKLTLRWAGS